MRLLQSLQRIRNDLSHGRGPRSRRSRSHPACESLETRALLSGTWTPIPPSSGGPSGDGAQSMVLLTNGTVLVHGGGGSQSSSYYELTPNLSGSFSNSYINGTWSNAALSNVGRLFDGTVVLPSGEVMVVGGEYSSDGGDTNTGEIYNPVTNKWSTIANFPQSKFGDDELQLLPDGQVLAGYLNGTQTYIYDPATNTWTATGSKQYSDVSDEESWVTLPDGSIVSYDIYSSITDNQGEAQLYIPSTGQWIKTGNVPVQLSGNSQGDELGPAFMLPDGRAWFTGANGNTAFYTPRPRRPRRRAPAPGRPAPPCRTA